MRVRRQLKKASFKAFMALDQLGIHILPKHYYTPIPNYSWLRSNPEAWTSAMPMTGMHWDLSEQLSWLEEICARYYDEVEGLQQFSQAERFGQGYGAIESQVLHCAIRELQPARIVEVGSGASTKHILQAVELNKHEGGQASSITCIEPYPKPDFLQLSGINHVRELVQTVPAKIFEELRSGDLLFIDSSHSVKVGSDVIRLYLEIIPSLSPGVYIHIHDIYLPYVYPRDVLQNYFGWQETALLLALLTHNPALQILACQSALHYDRPGALQAVLPDYLPQANNNGLVVGNDHGHFPSSLWLRTSAYQE